MNNPLKTTWDRYVATWKVESVSDTRALFEGILDPDCRYTDPLGATRGWDDLISYMTEFHRQMPGSHFVTTRFLSHNNRSVAAWNMVGRDGSVLGDGISYGEYNDAGQLVTMTGFYEWPNA
ncbi:MAG: nuclear transport factor 2 family protein [Myxococcota bacterium]